MCEWGTDKKIWLRIPAPFSHSGRARWKRVKVDACIAPIVRALRNGGINAEYSCCGHGKTDGLIRLTEGRSLIITTREDGPFKPNINGVYEELLERHKNLVAENLERKKMIEALTVCRDHWKISYEEAVRAAREYEKER